MHFQIRLCRIRANPKPRTDLLRFGDPYSVELPRPLRSRPLFDGRAEPFAGNARPIHVVITASCLPRRSKSRGVRSFSKLPSRPLD